MSRPIFSIVVCTYNSQQHISQTIKSLKALNYPNDKYEIIVVNDSSTDKTINIVKRFKNVRLINHDQNLGVAGARNTGLYAAHGKWVAYIDDDCIADPEWLTQLEASIKKRNVLGVGGLIAPQAEEHILQRYLYRSGYGRPASVASGKARGLFARFNTYIKDNFTQSTENIEPKRAYEVYGANSAFSRTKLLRIGGYDINLRSSEDSDICRRLSNEYPNRTMFFNPKARVSHKYTPSFTEYFTKIFKRQQDVWLYYRTQDKVPPIFPFPILIAVLCLASIIIAWWIPILLLACLPPLMYFWWTINAFRHGEVELLLYSYIQAFEEGVRALGLLIAGVRLTLPVNMNDKSKQVALSGTSVLLFVLLELTKSPIQLVYSLLFCLIMPGLLLAILLKMPTDRMQSLIYVPILSVAVLFLDAIFANIIIILSHSAISFSTSLFVSVIACTAISIMIPCIVLRRRAVSIDVSAIQWRTLGLLITAILLPIMAVAGSVLLNNSNNNMLNLGVLAVIALIYLLALLKRKAVPTRIIYVLVYSTSLALILMSSIRGDFLGGTDVSKEFYLFNLTNQIGHWLPSLYNDAYNSCLSINLVPILLANITKLSGEVIFRIVVPLIYALIPVVSYVIARRFINQRLALLAAIFFAIQPAFMTWASIPVRQIFGILFFSALILVILDKKLNNLAKLLTSVLFGFAMVVSHYSTTYIAIGTLSLAYVIQLAIYWFIDRRVNKPRTPFKPQPSGTLILSLVLASTVWYGLINHTSNNITDRITNGITNIVQGHWSDVLGDNHSEQTSIVDQINIFSAPRDPQYAWSEYLKKTFTKYQGSGIQPIQSVQNTATIVPKTQISLPYFINPHISNAISLIGEIIAKFTRIFLIIGFAVYIHRFVRAKSKVDVPYFTLIVSSGVALLLVIIVPNASIDYDVVRTSQQLLILLAIPTILGAYTITRAVMRKFNKRVSYCLLSAFFVLYFLFASGFIPQITGGSAPLLTLNNQGNQYNQGFVHTTDLSAGNWLLYNRDKSSVICSGYFGGTRLWDSGIVRPTFYDDILPWTIDSRAYVYATYSEIKNGTETAYYNGSFIDYSYPVQSLEMYKNLLYNNGNARIYK